MRPSKLAQFSLNHDLFEPPSSANAPAPPQRDGTQVVAVHTLTAEMELAISHALSGRDLKIVAYAGAAKTSTLVAIANAMPPARRGVYAAFNKSIATEAKTRFRANVRSSTFHSLAYRATAPEMLKKLSFPRLPGHEMARLHRLRDMTVTTILNDELVLEARSLGGMVADAVMRFCRSSSAQVEPWHVQPPKMICERDCADMAAMIAPIAQSHWDQVVSPTTYVPLSHDAYLKAWALKAPSISADFILFDEAQDADAVMLDVLKRQSAQVVYVGDPYQQIYEWRGAINALDTVAAQQSFLTQSFRFGPELARSANDFLDLLGATKPLVGYEILKTRVDWEPSEAPVDAILCRTNASGVAHGVAAMAAGLRVCLQVNGSEILAFADAAEALQQGRKPSDSEYAAFKHWSELVEFSETKAGSEYAPYVKLVNEHGVALLREVIHASVPHQKAQITISTAHRAKGLEWNRVRLADDFRLGAMTAEGYKLNESEARLDYVALTRAKAYVDASSLAGLLEEAQRELGCSAY